jgi:hypothetical protein
MKTFFTTRNIPGEEPWAVTKWNLNRQVGNETISYYAIENGEYNFVFGRNPRGFKTVRGQGGETYNYSKAKSNSYSFFGSTQYGFSDFLYNKAGADATVDEEREVTATASYNITGTGTLDRATSYGKTVTTSNIVSLKSDTAYYNNLKFPKGVQFYNTGYTPNPFRTHTVSNKLHASQDTFFKIGTTKSNNEYTRITVDSPLFDITHAILYSQEKNRRGGIVTARFGRGNLVNWNSMDDLLYSNDTFAHPYKEEPPAVVNGQNAANAVTKNYPPSTKVLKTTGQSSRYATTWNSNGISSRISSYYPVASVSSIILNGGSAEIPNGGQRYTYYGNTFSSYESVDRVEDTTILVKVSFDGLAVVTGYVNLWDPSNNGLDEVGYVAFGNGGRLIANAAQIHPYGNGYVFYEVFNKMICPFTMNSGNSFRADLRFYETFITKSLFSSTGRGNSFSPAVPIYNIIENVSHIVQDMYFSSTSSFNGTTTTTGTQKSEYLSTTTSYNERLGRMATALSKGTFYLPKTTTGSVKTSYYYNFKIVSFEDSKATFEETIYRKEGDLTGRFALELKQEVKDKLIFTKQPAFPDQNNYAFNFSFGGACSSFYPNRVVRLNLGIGLWDYTAYDSNLVIKGREKKELVMYRDVPTHFTVSPESQYFFKHTPKVKHVHYNNIAYVNQAIIQPSHYFAFYSQWVGGNTIDTFRSNIYHEDLNPPADVQKRDLYSSVSDRINPFKNYIHFT